MPYTIRCLRVNGSLLANNAPRLISPRIQIIPCRALTRADHRSQSTISSSLPSSTVNSTSILNTTDRPSLNDSASDQGSSCAPNGHQGPPLGKLPLVNLLRSLLLHTVSSSPALLSITTKVLLKNADNLDSPISPLRFLIRKTFYTHFCGGENVKEIRNTVGQLKDLGIKGVVLAYARELDLTELNALQNGTADKDLLDIAEWRAINQWLDGNLRTIEYTPRGDFAAIKFTGAGSAVLRLLSATPPQDPESIKQLSEGLERVCDFAQKRNVKLLLDAEQQSVQHGIDQWALKFMRKYNKNPSGEALIYNTYQMYLRSSPENLRRHMSIAAREGFKLGVKLVRGAYLSTDPRDKICETKEDTDKQYDEAVKMMMAERTTKIDLVLASHNKESVIRAAEAYAKYNSPGQKEGGVDRLVFAQLMGMADELSFGLADTLMPTTSLKSTGIGDEKFKIYKYVTWGSIPECVKYLLRRAEENKEAVGRSRENMVECWREIRRRLTG